MPTPTYEPIATASPSGTNGVTFSSIPQTYTDLRVVWYYKSTDASNRNAINCYPNGDATGNKCIQSFRTNGSNAEAIGQINVIAWGDYYTVPILGTNLWAMSVWDIPNYASTNAQKLAMIQHSGLPDYSEEISVYMASVGAITSLTFYAAFGNFVAGSTATLFGIKAA